MLGIRPEKSRESQPLLGGCYGLIRCEWALILEGELISDVRTAGI